MTIDIETARRAIIRKMKDEQQAARGSAPENFASLVTAIAVADMLDNEPGLRILLGTFNRTAKALGLTEH